MKREPPQWISVMSNSSQSRVKQALVKREEIVVVTLDSDEEQQSQSRVKQALVKL